MNKLSIKAQIEIKEEAAKLERAMMYVYEKANLRENSNLEVLLFKYLRDYYVNYLNWVENMMLKSPNEFVISCYRCVEINYCFIHKALNLLGDKNLRTELGAAINFHGASDDPLRMPGVCPYLVQGFLANANAKNGS